MLQSLRRQASSFVVKILLGLLILSFAAWGISDIFLGARDPVVAEVGDVKILSSQLERAFRQELSRMAPLFRGRLDREQAKQIGLLDQALEKLINRAVFQFGTRDLGIAISDDLIRRIIRDEPRFRNQRGEFDPVVFKQVLFANGLSEDSYVEDLRQDLASSQLAAAIAAHAGVPGRMLDALYRFREERRVAEHVLVPNSSVSGVGVPGEAEIVEFHKSNAARFMAPEYRAVTYVSLDPQSLAAEIRISEEKLREEYENRLDDFTVRERRKADQIVFKDETAARQAHGSLRRGRTFEAVAKEVGGGGGGVISLGWVERADLITELIRPTFALQDGEFSAPVKSPLGWHIVRVTASEKGRVKSLGEVRERLAKDMAARLAVDGIYRRADELEDTLAGGASIREAARTLNLKAVKVAAIDSRGFTPARKAAEGFAKSASFLTVAFATPEGQESELIETAEGGYFILRVDKITAPALRPLETVRQEVIAAWQADRRARAAGKRAAAILKRINDGEDFAAI
ncbi:MAG: SurA N-terminal domain-containing protein, partial [Alphaproteobacteria bacterium]